jgi:XapX domain-containing protein
MRILIAFIVAFGIGAGSRWTGVPSLAPQAIIGAFLIVAMSAGYVSADHASEAYLFTLSNGLRIDGHRG